jgi:predicted RNA-binding protein
MELLAEAELEIEAGGEGVVVLDVFGAPSLRIMEEFGKVREEGPARSRGQYA